jgi:hypothetical protein
MYKSPDVVKYISELHCMWITWQDESIMVICEEPPQV